MERVKQVPKPTDDPIGDYIAEQDENVRPLLQIIRKSIRAAAPDATE
jgi:hypothetical protein